LSNVVRVCKKWNDALKEEYFWKNKFLIDFGDDFSSFKDESLANKEQYKSVYSSRFLILSGETEGIKVQDVYNQIISKNLLLKNQIEFLNLRKIDTSDPLYVKSPAEWFRRKVAKFNCIFFWSNQNTFHDPFNTQLLGDLLSEYVDNNGGLVVAIFSISGFALGGKFTLKYPTDHQSRNSNSKNEPLWEVEKAPTNNHSIMSNIRVISPGPSSYMFGGNPSTGAKTLVTYTSDAVLPLVMQKNRVLALNIYPPSNGARVDFWDAKKYDNSQLIVNCCKFIKGTPKYNFQDLEMYMM